MNDHPRQVLIVDDEQPVCTFFRRLLTRQGYSVTTAVSRAEAERALKGHRFAVALVDLKLPDTDGLSLLQLIKGRQPACEVILMTGYSTVRTAVEAIRLGAYEYLEKPFDDIAEIEALVARAARRGGQPSAAAEWGEVARGVGLQVGRSPAMRRLVELAYKIAGKKINLLIQGQTGTGKEVLARFVHAASPRAGQAFIPVNCGALPENLLESELFGHEKGAFTGAAQARRGIFELADGGTLFLDEIGDASLPIQVKLLRALETGEFHRVGGERPIRTDVRLIAATHVDLEQAVREGRFRQDLYYRLNVVRLEIPPLRARGEDIADLASHFLQRFNPALRLAPSAVAALEGYGWPGNVRELANLMRRAAVFCADASVLPEHLGELRDAPAPPAAPGAPADPWAHYAREETLAAMANGELNQLLHALRGLETRVLDTLHRRGDAPGRTSLRQREAETIRKALEQHRWNITHTARALGIARNTLHRKINRLGLRPG